MDYHRKYGLTINRPDTTTVYLKDIQKIVKALFKLESKESDELQFEQNYSTAHQQLN